MPFMGASGVTKKKQRTFTLGRKGRGRETEGKGCKQFALYVRIVSLIFLKKTCKKGSNKKGRSSERAGRECKKTRFSMSFGAVLASCHITDEGRAPCVCLIMRQKLYEKSYTIRDF